MNLPKINIKKYLSKKYWKIHAAILVGLVAVVTLILCLTLGGKNATPEETTPDNTTPEATTPEVTTPEVTEPEVTEPVTEPATEPATEPVTEPVTEPAA